MTTPPTPPSPGKPVSAGFFARLIGWVKSVALVEGPGYRLSRTPNGTVLKIDQPKLPKTAHLPTCFEYGGATDEDGNKYYGRPYFMVGSRLYRAQDEDCACGTQPGIDYLDVSLDEGNAVAVVHHATDYAQLQTRADDKDHAVIPLYELGEGGTPVADLRTMPLISSWEFES